MKHLTKEQLRDIKEKLIELRNEILAEMRDGSEDLQAQHEDDPEDVILSDTSAALQDKKTHLFHKVEEALASIKLGTYGYCEETGEPITYKRLNILPYTRLSVEGKRLREEERMLRA